MREQKDSWKKGIDLQEKMKDLKSGFAKWSLNRGMIIVYKSLNHILKGEQGEIIIH